MRQAYGHAMFLASVFLATVFFGLLQMRQVGCDRTATACALALLILAGAMGATVAADVTGLVGSDVTAGAFIFCGIAASLSSLRFLGYEQVPASAPIRR